MIKRTQSRLSVVFTILVLALSSLTFTVAGHEDTETVAEAIVQTANIYLSSLDESQTESSVFEFYSIQKNTWSNLPTDSATRAGISFAEMTDDQKLAFDNLLAASLSDSGFERVQAIITADDYLSETTGNDRVIWDSEAYYVSFYGDPSLEDVWGFQLTGHHLAVNLTMVDGHISITPTHLGIEPVVFSYEGVDYTPLEDLSETGFALYDALDTEQQADATINNEGLVLGAGEDGTDAPEQVGVSVGDMTEEQQALVVEIITAYFSIADEAFAEDMIAEYTEAFAETTFAWGGDTDIDTATSAYYRLHGPSIWIEFSMEPATGASVELGDFHYHTMMRDLTNDYSEADIATVEGDTVAEVEEETVAEVVSEQVEITVIDPLDGVTNSYCIDIAGGNENVDPANGLQAHTCYSYQGDLGTDQIFDTAGFASGTLYMPVYDVCAQVTSVSAGATIGLATCDGSDLQTFVFGDGGTISPASDTSLCFTASAETRFGRSDVHQISDLTLDACSDDLAIYQQWGYRSTLEDEITVLGS